MHKRSSLARLLTACVVFFVEEHISVTASNTSAELAGRAALKMDCNVSAWTEAGVWLQLQDDKAISRRADPRVQSMNHTSDYSARGNRLCIVFPGQMWAPGERDPTFQNQRKTTQRWKRPRLFTFPFHYTPNCLVPVEHSLSRLLALLQFFQGSNLETFAGWNLVEVTKQSWNSSEAPFFCLTVELDSNYQPFIYSICSVQNVAPSFKKIY